MVVIQYTQENYWRKILAQVTLNPLLASIHLFTPSIHKYVVDSLWDDVTLAFTLRDFHGAEYTSASYLSRYTFLKKDCELLQKSWHFAA